MRRRGVRCSNMIRTRRGGGHKYFNLLRELNCVVTLFVHHVHRENMMCFTSIWHIFSLSDPCGVLVSIGLL